MPLLITLLTAIPKADQATLSAALLHPILVTSIWYRILTRVFSMRLNSFLPRIFSTEQHGFCPHRSTMTAMATIVPTVEWCKLNKMPIYIAAVDINKAYDSVSRPALSRVLDHLGLGNNTFIQFIL